MLGYFVKYGTYLTLIAQDRLSPALRADPDSFRAQKEIKTM